MSDLIIPETTHGSPLSEHEALGHVSDKIGEIRDALIALAVQQPMTRMGQQYGPRQAFAFLIGKLTEGRDAMRAVSLLRGDKQWLMLARQMDSARDHVTRLSKSSSLGKWPAPQFLALARAFEAIHHLVERRKTRALKVSIIGATMH